MNGYRNSRRIYIVYFLVPAMHDVA